MFDSKASRRRYLLRREIDRDVCMSEYLSSYLGSRLITEEEKIQYEKSIPKDSGYLQNEIKLRQKLRNSNNDSNNNDSSERKYMYGK